MPAHVLLLTSTNLASDPRCLKEARLLCSLGFRVSVVAFDLHNWTTEMEKALNAELGNVNFYYLESTKQSFFPWILSSLLEKTSRVFLPVLPSNRLLSSVAVGKRAWLLLKWVKKWIVKADMVIAHNPAAFYPAYIYSKKNRIPFALDIEDFHPGEGDDQKIRQASALLMKDLIPHAAYTSFASPIIKKYSEEVVGETSGLSLIVVNNVFPQGDFLNPQINSTVTGKLRLVWFSQFVDYGRGLEKLLPVLDQFGEIFELTLIGNLRDDFYKNELKHRKYCHCLPSRPQTQLHQELHRFDIGIAIEDRDADINRNICLTNKIWAYFQAGLYIVASDTDAQKIFLEQHGDHGVCTSLLPGGLQKTLEGISGNTASVRAGRVSRFQRALPFSWESEQEKLKQFFPSAGP